MDYKMQCFIYYKYVSFYDRKTIQYKMFIKSEKTYMKLNRQAKAFVNDFWYWPNRGGVKIPWSDK